MGQIADSGSRLFRPDAEAPQQVMSRAGSEARLITPGRWFLACGLLIALVGGIVSLSIVHVATTISGPAVVATADTGSRIEATTAGQVVKVYVRAGSLVRKGDGIVAMRDARGQVQRIRALSNGQVRDLLVQPGEMVKWGDLLGYVSPANAQLVARLVVPVARMGDIEPGMPARISPLGTSQATDGQLEGTVSNVVRGPLPPSLLESMSQPLSSVMPSEQPKGIVVVSLGEADGLTWTLGRSPGGEIGPGTIGTGEVTVSEQSLLDYLFGPAA